MKAKSLIYLFSLLVCMGSIAMAGDVPVSERLQIERNLQRLLETKDCEQCNLTGVMLNRADLSEANLEDAVLIGANLYLADLSGANLQGANLQRAGLGGADLANADLRNANLQGAVLEGAYLVGAKMAGCVIGPAGSGNEQLSAQEQRIALMPTGHKDRSGADKGVVIGERRDFEEAPPSVRSSDDKGKTGRAGQPNVRAKQSPVLSADNTTRKSGSDNQSVDTLRQSKKLVAMADMSQAPEAWPQSSSVVGASVSTQEQTGNNNISESGFFGRLSRSFTEIFSSESKGEPGEEVVEEATRGDSLPESTRQQPAQSVAEAGPRENTHKQKSPETVLSMDSGPVSSAGTPGPATQAKKLLLEKLFAENRCVACDLSGVDLSNADLDGADLERSDLSGVIFRDADLRETNLKGADLSGADLRNTDLREADLYSADLSGSDLTGAKLEGALIDSVDFSGAIGVNFEGAIRDE